MVDRPGTHLAQSNIGAGIQSIHLGVSQNITIGATHAENGTPFQDSTTVLRVCSSVDCWIATGRAGVAATTGSAYLPAKAIEYINICKGELISVIETGGAGTLNVTEGN